jgi:hypothetical protein
LVGMVPRESSTGGKQKLLGISKRGNFAQLVYPGSSRGNVARYQAISGPKNMDRGDRSA